MRLMFFLGAVFLAQLIEAQNFTEVPHFNTFVGVYGGCVSIADVNGDAFPDVLVTGRKNGNTLSSKLYINDGLGNYSERVEPPFPSVGFGSMAVADMNGDQHPDVILTGRIDQYGRVPPSAKLFINDGTGNFSEVKDTPFSRVSKSAIAVKDVNGDSFIDVLITGKNMSGIPIAKLYTNDGVGHFTEVLNAPFVGVERGAVAIADVNGDKHPDILITGKKGNLSFTSKLYINDGLGRFSEMPNTPFADVFLSAVAIADVNDDQHPDVLISGVGDSIVKSMKLYINDGFGNFTEMLDTPFDGMDWSSIAIADVTGDQYPDVLCSGETSGRKEQMKLYTNDGLGNFTEMPASPFVDVSSSTITIGDINGDLQSDVIITGKKFGLAIMRVYTNSGLGHFEVMEELPFVRVQYSSVALTDLNGDRHPDALITGRTGGSNRRYYRRTILYTNDGTGRFSELENTPFVGVSNSTVAVADVNGDKNPDVLISGITITNESVTKLYTGTESGDFTEVPGTPFEGLYDGSVAIADVNGDQNPDILITGQCDHKKPPVTKLYLNAGTGKFRELRKTLFPGVRHSSVAIADLSGDQNPDILITGEDGLGNAITKLYLNSGSGKFSEMNDTPFPGVFHSSVAITDVNGDGHSDIFLSGKITLGDPPITKLYVNIGAGHFKEVNTPFEGVMAGSVVVADVNGDLHPDVFISGQKEWEDFISKLYINDGVGNFREVVGTPFEGVGWGAVAIKDVTGDHRPDILITGKTGSMEITRLYIQSED